MLFSTPTTGVVRGCSRKVCFVYLFESFLPLGTVGIVAVGWRVVAEYLPFFIGMYSVFTLYGRQFVAGAAMTDEQEKDGGNNIG